MPLLAIREILPAAVVIFPVTTIFRPVRLTAPELFAEISCVTEMLFPVVVSDRFAP